jgi:hypothetical protein
MSKSKNPATNHVPTPRTSCRSPNAEPRSDHGLGAGTIVMSPAHRPLPSLPHNTPIPRTSPYVSVSLPVEGERSVYAHRVERRKYRECMWEARVCADSPSPGLLCSFRAPIHSIYSRWGCALPAPRERKGKAGGSRPGER